jgi:hypothetical protein
MDSIDIYKEHYAINNAGGLIFTIVQKSIRFEKMKKLVVYTEHEYLGNYEVVDFHTFRIKNLSNMVSLLIFGEHERYGKELLMRFKVKGRISESTEMYFVCLKYIGFDEKFKIKRPDYEKEREKRSAKAVRDDERQSVSDAGSDQLDVAPF